MQHFQKGGNMTTRKNTVADKLSRAQLTINNTLNDPEIQEPVAKFGYTAEKMQAGKTLYDETMHLVNARAQKIGTHTQARGEFETGLEHAFGIYQSLTKVCLAIFSRNKSRLAFLGIQGKMPRRGTAFFPVAYTLFDNAQTPEIQTELAQYGYDIPKLQADREQIAAVDRAYQKQEQTRGTKQQSRSEQSAAINKLEDWVRQYHKIAKVALKNKPELLEKLGIRVLTGRTPAQRAAGAKASQTRAANRASENSEVPPAEESSNPDTPKNP
jgi:hypothetical protein